MSAAAVWGFDADEHDPLTALRIPVTSFSPRWKYVAAFDRESEARPTDVEARQLASFIEEYVTHWFNESYIAKLRERPLDVDSGCPTWIFHKWAEGDWSYRVSTWDRGPMWVPVFPRQRGGEYNKGGLGPLTLVAVMDRIRDYGEGRPNPRWEDWKTSHADVFGGAS